jgi:serine phosphatase RsbU (regulator of sigma subunit)
LGFPIGLEPEISDFINQVEISLNTGDVVVLYTDGITEAENPQSEQYGLENLCRGLKANYDRSAFQIRSQIIHDLKMHISTQKIFDDITLLVIKQN